jgi:hypothetical protein
MFLSLKSEPNFSIQLLAVCGFSFMASKPRPNTGRIKPFGPIGLVHCRLPGLLWKGSARFNFFAAIVYGATLFLKYGNTGCSPIQLTSNASFTPGSMT